MKMILLSLLKYCTILNSKLHYINLVFFFSLISKVYVLACGPFGRQLD